ncbi:hypothetical protein V2J09_003140 [Rumex salicifolius]
MEQVKLLGCWPSVYSYRVIWALELKGVNYQYIEEDIANKSDDLLLYNPVYKRIPVLLHNHKSVAESMIILEYIDEVWPHKPLLPSDPYGRAVARFWIQFAVDKNKVFYTYFQASGEEQEVAAKEARQVLRMIEEIGLGDKRFFGGNEVGMADLAFGWLAWWLEPMETVTGLKLLDPYHFPKLSAWIDEFIGIPVIRENLPDRDQLLTYIKNLRTKFTA